MPDYRSMFDRKYLGAWDLAGRDVTVTIESVRAEKISNGKATDKRPVVKLRGTEKEFLCNKTNAKTIASLYGPNTDAWLGKRVTLYPTQASFGGQMVDAIRVRPTIPQRTGRPVQSQPVDPEMRARQDAAAEAVGERPAPVTEDGEVTGDAAEPEGDADG